MQSPDVNASEGSLRTRSRDTRSAGPLSALAGTRALGTVQGGVWGPTIGLECAPLVRKRFSLCGPVHLALCAPAQRTGLYRPDYQCDVSR